MSFVSLPDFINRGVGALGKGPIAILLMEDLSETNSTIRHHLRLGFRDIVVLGTDALEISPELRNQIHQINYDLTETGALETAINALIEAMPNRWMYYCYNAEYLFFPFSESRTVGEMIAFCTEERRDSILTYVIDLYADDLDAHKNGVSLADAHLDQSGYYAQARSEDDIVMDRQLDMFGGLRWRFEEHVPAERRKIDRIGIFRAQKGLQLRANHTFNMPEYNTYSCAWHNNITASICSFRAAKSLCTNPGSAFDINTFMWHNSQKFAWHPQQLLDLGLMEPGQWF